MALQQLPLQFPINSVSHPQFRKLNKATQTTLLKKTQYPNQLKLRARGSSSEKEEEEKPTNTEDGISDIGSEIRKAMEEREDREGFWDGVVKEVKEIEWPAFGKVVGTTGVVLAVISGSSLVLLSLNAVLSELSDKLFSGRGVQDFFG